MINTKSRQADRLGGVNTRRSLSPKESKSFMPEQRLCECGAKIEAIPIVWRPGRPHWPARCWACEQRQEAQRQRRQVRLRRRARQQILGKRLGATIPQLFRRAHIRHLGEVVRNKILGLVPARGGYLYGAPGRGKTYSLCAIARLMITEGYNVRRVVWERLSLDIRDTFKSNHTSELDLIGPLIDCDVLIIEDVGTTTSTGGMESDFNLRLLLTILDSRLESHRPTWLSSNKSVEQLAQTFDDRIASRLYGHCKIILLAGPDRRKMHNRSD